MRKRHKNYKKTLKDKALRSARLNGLEDNGQLINGRNYARDSQGRFAARNGQRAVADNKNTPKLRKVNPGARNQRKYTSIKLSSAYKL